MCILKYIQHKKQDKTPAVHNLKNSELAAIENLIFSDRRHNAYLVCSYSLDLNRQNKVR